MKDWVHGISQADVCSTRPRFHPKGHWLERTLKSLGESPRLRRILKEHVPRSVVQRVADVLGKGREGSIDLGHGVKLSYELNDVYWTQYARNPRDYEPELWHVIDKFAGPDTLFIDGGANIGFWSTVAASRIKNKDRVIAIEASDEVLPRLLANQRLNQASFTVLPRAIWSNSHETLTFTVSSSHQASGLVDDGEFRALRKIQVQTVSVDDIVRDAAGKNIRNPDVIVKLDVEGTELQGLRGMRDTLKVHNTLLVYEDHSKDKGSETTARVLAEGLNLYYIDGDTQTARLIHDSKELEAIKTVSHRGYNFIACVPSSKFDAALEGGS
jgi:FkbM family methyltransferase